MIFFERKNSVEIYWSDNAISCSFADDEVIAFCVRGFALGRIAIVYLLFLYFRRVIVLWAGRFAQIEFILKGQQKSRNVMHYGIFLQNRRILSSLVIKNSYSF